MQRTVVHFSDSDTFGGCEEVILNLIRGLDRAAWRPVLVHRDVPGIGRLVNELVRDDVLCRPIPSVRRGRIASLSALARELTRLRPSIFHAHLNWPLGCRHELPTAQLLQVSGVVATAHLCPPPAAAIRFREAKLRVQRWSVDRFIAVSDEVRTCLAAQYGVRSDQVTVVRNGVPAPRVDPSSIRAVRAELGETGRPIVFTPARLHTQKGHEHLLRAAVSIPEALFVLAGEGPERERLEQLANELGIGTRVRFLGQRTDVATLLANCDLFVLPSLYEGLPLSVLEAMRAGKPVIATAIGGTTEAIEDGDSGLLVPAGDPDALALAIRRLLIDRPLADRIGRSALRRADTEFSSEAMSARTVTVYEDVLSRRR